MARDPELAKFLSKIAACHTATLPGARLHFWSGPHHLGYVTTEFAEKLRETCPEITVTDRVTLAPEALPRLNAIAAAAGANFRGENFDVRENWTAPFSPC